MAELLRRLGCDVVHDRPPVRCRSRCPRCPRARSRLRPRPQARARSINVLGRCSPAAARPTSPARRRQHRQRAASTCTSPASSGSARPCGEHGYLIATRGPAARASGVPDFPASAPPRTSLMAAVLAKGHDRHRQRRASPRSSTSAACSSRWARRSTASARRRSPSRASDVLAGRARDRARPARGRHVGGRRCHDARRHHDPQRAERPPRHRARQAS